MSSGFNNFNSTIGNQVIGTLNIGSTKDNEIAFVHQQLDVLLEHINADVATTRIDMQNALNAIEDIRSELAHKSPKTEILERSLSVIGSVSSVAPLVDQIRTFLINML